MNPMPKLAHLKWPMTIMLPMTFPMMPRLRRHHLRGLPRRAVEHDMVLDPVDDGLPPAALVQGVEAGRLAAEALGVVPDKVRRHVAGAHDVHAQRLDAVVHVPPHLLRPAVPRRRAAVVPVLPVRVLPHEVEAVDLVEALEEADGGSVRVARVHPAPVGLGVLLQGADLADGDGECSVWEGGGVREQPCG